MGSTSPEAPKAKDEHGTDRSVTPPGATRDRTEEESLDDRLDEALAESFPASDPPAVHRS